MDDSRPLRWLYLDLNSYFASVEQQLDPRLRGRPVVVAPVDTDSTCAIAASYEAKAFGIKTGTRIWEAKAKCRDLVIVPGRHDQYVRFHHKIVGEVERHVPVFAVCSIDEVACRLLDNENSRAGVVALAARIKAGIRANVGQCLTSSIGVAPNRLVAKMAADMKKPDGLTVLEAHEIEARLKTLPLSDIPGVGRNMAARLARAGVVSMERLLALDARAARQVWGSVLGERMYWLLRGHDLPEIETVSRSIGHSHVLAPELRPLPAARLVARRLTAKAATRLRRAEKRCARLGLMVKTDALRDEPARRWTGEVKLAPVMDTPALLTALEALWAEMRVRLGAQRLLQVGVVLSDLSGADAVQLDMFAGGCVRSERRALALSHAMDRLNARFGRDAVTLGHDRRGATRSSGPRIAFTRIPEMAEFRE